MPNFPQITPTEAARRQSMGALLIDVRSPDEFARSHLPAARNIPLAQLPTQIRHLAHPSREIMLFCSHGQRSHSAALVLSRLGYRNISIII